MAGKGIAIIGRTAEAVNLTDGQTVKTKILRDELLLAYPDRKLIVVDTYQYKKHVFAILKKLFMAFIQCEDIFVMLSRNGRTYLFPIINGLNHIFRRRLYHDVIGGALPEEASNSPFLVAQLNKFDVNWVEFESMKNQLEALGVKNVEVLPNFKRLIPLNETELDPWEQPEFVFSTFSRVIQSKGIDTAAMAIAEVNRRYGNRIARLQIYGPVDEEYMEEFEVLLQNHGDCIDYKGCIPYGESVEALRDSYMLLFPSVYHGEGMPGTIIDAFSAGLPVIATDWHFNGELVKNGVTGYCYDWRKPEQLTEYILHAITHPEDVHSMKKHCLRALEPYTVERGMAIIRNRMDGYQKA